MEEIITTEWSAWKECHSWRRSTGVHSSCDRGYSKLFSSLFKLGVSKPTEISWE